MSYHSRGARGTKRDANEPTIVAALFAVGCMPVMRMKPEQGFDLLVGYRGIWYALEVKNPEYVPKKSKKPRFTPNELIAMSHWAGPIHVVTNATEALFAIGAQ